MYECVKVDIFTKRHDQTEKWFVTHSLSTVAILSSGSNGAGGTGGSRGTRGSRRTALSTVSLKHKQKIIKFSPALISVFYYHGLSSPMFKEFKGRP